MKGFRKFYQSAQEGKGMQTEKNMDTKSKRWDRFMVGKQGFGCSNWKKGGRGRGDRDNKRELSLEKSQSWGFIQRWWEPSISRVLGRGGQDHNCLKGRNLEKEHRVCARAAEIKRNGRRDATNGD